MQPLRLVALVGAVSLPVKSYSQSGELPAMPDATIIAAQDRDHMMCEPGLIFPSLPPRLQDPHRLVNAGPVNAANPEGNWTDPLAHTVVPATCRYVSRHGVPGHLAHGDAIGGCLKQ